MQQPKTILSKTQNLILLLFYRFRFLTRKHIQKLLNHKSHSLVSEWIKGLLEQGYLLAKEKDDPTDIREPEILYLSSQSIQTLKKNKDCSKKVLRNFYREDERSAEFAYKCLKVTDLKLIYKSKYQNTATVYFYTQSDLVNHNYFPKPKPSCYVSLEFKDKITERYFIEVIAPNTYKYQLEYLTKKYLEYLDEGIWQSKTPYPFPTIQLICPDQKTKNTLDKYLEETVYEEYEKNEILFEAITNKDL